MNRIKVLIVDDDPSTITVVRLALLERGHEVEFAYSGKDGLLKVDLNPPDVIILDVVMPEMSGWEVLHRLRTTPRLALVPVVFLTGRSSKEDRIRGFKIGADDYVPKPFEVDELVARVERAADRRSGLEKNLEERTLPIPKKPKGFQGNLKEIGLASILSLMEAEKSTGILTVTGPPKLPTGHISLREGNLVRAELVGQGSRTNEDALFVMLSWDEGAFSFHRTAVTGEDEIRQSTMALLLEGARRIDTTSRGGPDTPSNGGDP